jgi:hypothetical protein
MLTRDIAMLSVYLYSRLTLCHTWTLNAWTNQSEYGWQWVSQSVCLGVEPTLWTFDQILLRVQRLQSGSYYPISVGHPLWREAGSVLCESQSSHSSVPEPVILNPRMYKHAAVVARLTCIEPSFHSKSGGTSIVLSHFNPIWDPVSLFPKVRYDIILPF